MGLIIVCGCNKPTSVGRSREDGVSLVIKHVPLYCAHKKCGRRLDIKASHLNDQELVRNVRAKLLRKRDRSIGG